MKTDYKLIKYKKNLEYSYSFGAFPTIELLNNAGENVLKVIYHSDSIGSPKISMIKKLCNSLNIRTEENSKLVEKLRDKENCHVIGVLKKYQSSLAQSSNHVVLVNPSDMGNFGTILRTCLGFGVKDIAVIEPAVDYFNPKVIRASMGAIFAMNVFSYSSFSEYIKENNINREFYPFMLNGKTELSNLVSKDRTGFSLIFGNESSGLDESFRDIGNSVYIKHSDEIDSLNLSIAVGLALYHFSV